MTTTIYYAFFGTLLFLIISGPGLMLCQKLWSMHSKAKNAASLREVIAGSADPDGVRRVLDETCEEMKNRWAEERKLWKGPRTT